MNESQSTVQNFGFSVMHESERRVMSMRARLQELFGELCLVRDVITVSVEAVHTQVSDFDPEVGRVLFRCGAEKLYTKLDSLSDIIEQLGGRTEITDCRDQSRSSTKREATHVGA